MAGLYVKKVNWVAVPVAALVLAGVLGQPAQAVGDAPAAESASSGAPAAAAAEAAAPEVSPIEYAAVAPKAPKWWKFLKHDGKPLEVFDSEQYAEAPAFWVAVGKTYHLRGTLPAKMRDALAGKKMRLEAKSETGSTWRVLARFTPRSNGRFEAKIRIPKSLLGDHEYRITAAGGTRSERTVVVLPGSTLTAVATSQFWLAITNDAKSDLVFTIPTALDDTSGQYASTPIQVNQNDSATITYVNPIPDVTTVGFHVQRTDCFLGCTTYSANWNHAPNNNYTACSVVSPTFNAGSSYTIRVTPEAGGPNSGFDMFLLDGSGNVICTGSLDTAFQQWLGNNPVAKWALIYFAADAAINVIAGIAFAGEAIGAAIFADEAVELLYTEYEALDQEGQLMCDVINAATGVVVETLVGPCPAA